MKVLIELDDDVFKDIRESNFDSARAIVRNFQATITDAIRSGTPIPDNATNGDMIKAMFPNCQIVENVKDTYTILLDSNNILSPKLIVFNDWWNAPYKADMRNEHTKFIEPKSNPDLPFG